MQERLGDVLGSAPGEPESDDEAFEQVRERVQALISAARTLSDTCADLADALRPVPGMAPDDPIVAGFGRLRAERTAALLDEAASAARGTLGLLHSAYGALDNQRARVGPPVPRVAAGPGRTRSSRCRRGRSPWTTRPVRRSRRGRGRGRGRRRRTRRTRTGCPPPAGDSAPAEDWPTAADEPAETGEPTDTADGGAGRTDGYRGGGASRRTPSRHGLRRPRQRPDQPTDHPDVSANGDAAVADDHDSRRATPIGGRGEWDRRQPTTGEAVGEPAARRRPACHGRADDEMDSGRAAGDLDRDAARPADAGPEADEADRRSGDDCGGRSGHGRAGRGRVRRPGRGGGRCVRRASCGGGRHDAGRARTPGTADAAGEAADAGRGGGGRGRRSGGR